MTAAEIVIAYIKNEIMPAEPDVSLGLDDDLLELAPIDSMGVVHLVTFLEQSFDIKIRPGEITITNFGTVGAILALIARKQSET